MAVTRLDTVPAPVAFWRRVRGWASSIRWYLTTLMGDRAYETYVGHCRAQHPDAAIPTEREFWRDRMAAQDANPGARCC